MNKFSAPDIFVYIAFIFFLASVVFCYWNVINSVVEEKTECCEFRDNLNKGRIIFENDRIRLIQKD